MKHLLTLFVLIQTGCSTLDTSDISQFETGCSSVIHVSGVKDLNTIWCGQEFWVVHGCNKTFCCTYNGTTSCKECK